jgi:hypothetical protein
MTVRTPSLGLSKNKDRDNGQSGQVDHWNTPVICMPFALAKKKKKKKLKLMSVLQEWLKMD